MKFLKIVLALLLGGVYIFSAYSKLFPIEPFEYTFVDLGVSNWTLAPFMARSLIGLEFFVGLLFIFQLGTRSFTSKLSIVLLSLFTLYLTLLVLRNGNNSNCGCFGEMLPMTPLQSIFKNLLLIVLSVFLLKRGFEVNYKKAKKWVIISFALIAFIYPYIRNVVDLDYSESYLLKKEETFFLPMDTLIVNAAVNKVPQEIKTGKHIVIFVSSTCPHCKNAASKLRIMKEKNPALPVYFVINGLDEDIKRFREYTKSKAIPWTKLNGRSFIYLAGTTLPRIFLVNNQVVELEVNYYALDQDEIEKWLQK